MISRFFHALLAASVVAGAAAAASYGATHWAPQGRAREFAERWVTAPGHAVYARLTADREAQKKVRAGEERLARAGVDLKMIQDSLVGQELGHAASKTQAEARRLAHLYNVGAWAGAGFVVCLAFTLFLGIESIGAALVLGFKVTLALIFLQGALILGGVLVLAKLAG